MTQGIRDLMLRIRCAHEPARRNWHGQLAELRTGGGQDLPPVLKAEIERECKRLWLVIEMIRAVESERDALAAGEGKGKVARLTRLSGIAAISAHILAGEVFHRAFANRREVAAYCGLSSSPYNSGSLVREQESSRAGNRQARCAAIELAWL